MWFVILLLAPAVVIVHGHYISRQLERAVAALIPRATSVAGRIRLAYLGLTYTVPALLLLWVIYVVVARPDHAGPPVFFVLDYLIVLPFWLVTIYAAQCTLLIAPVHVIAWGAQRLRGPLDARWQRRRHAYALIVAALFLVYMPVRIAIDQRSIDVRHHEVARPDLPAELDGFTIALIADPQADQYTTGPRLAQLVDATNELEPDLVLIAGDIVTRAPRYIEPAAEALGALRAPHGVLSAIGDHENFVYRDRARSVGEVRDALAARDIAMLDDEVRRIAVGGREVAVAVATHNYVTPIEPDAARAVVAATAGADVRVVLAHQSGSALIDAARDAGVDLYLSGHTHGGQVRLWFFGLDLIAARLESPYITGHYTGGALGDLDLVVSSGLGVSVIPFRYRAPATVDLLTLRRR